MNAKVVSPPGNQGLNGLLLQVPDHSEHVPYHYHQPQESPSMFVEKEKLRLWLLCKQSL